MKFIEFNADETPTIYPVDQIEYISLFDLGNDSNGVIKIIMWLKGQESGVAEYFCYDESRHLRKAQKAARKRFNELLALLNAQT